MAACYFRVMKKLMYVLLLGLLGSCVPNFLNPPGVRVYMESFPNVPLPSDAELTVRILDISRADAPAAIVAERVQKSLGQFPVNLFFVPYDPAKVKPNARYAVSASIAAPSGLRLQTQTITPVTLGGGVEYVKLEAVRVSAPSMASLSGRVSWPSQPALSGNAKLTVRLVEAGYATVAEKTYLLDDLGFSNRFSLEYDTTLLSTSGRYVLIASLRTGEKVLFRASQEVSLPELFGVQLVLQAVQ